MPNPHTLPVGSEFYFSQVDGVQRVFVDAPPQPRWALHCSKSLR
jgi:hypothetical protein